MVPKPSPAEVRINVSLTDIPLVDALKHVTDLAGVKFSVSPYAVIVGLDYGKTDVLVARNGGYVPLPFPLQTPRRVPGHRNAISTGSLCGSPAPSRLIVTILRIKLISWIC